METQDYNKCRESVVVKQDSAAKWKCKAVQHPADPCLVFRRRCGRSIGFDRVGLSNGKGGGDGVERSDEMSGDAWVAARQVQVLNWRGKRLFWASNSVDGNSEPERAPSPGNSWPPCESLA